MAGPLPLLRALVVAAAGLAAAAAAAQTARESPARITPTAATSACIGQATSPICAAETLLACVARADASLCRAVNANPPGALSQGGPQVEYVIEQVSVIRPDNITDDLKDLEWYKPGYTLVEMSRRACPATRADCGNESWEGVQVYLRRRDSAATAWEIVHWRTDAEPDTPPEEPENFQTATMPRPAR